jgi:hypothetical protein
VSGEVRRLYCARHLCSPSPSVATSVGDLGRGDKYTSLTSVGREGLMMVVCFETDALVVWWSLRVSLAFSFHIISDELTNLTDYSRIEIKS